MMEHRWLTDKEIETLVNPSLRNRGMAELNINPDQPTCRVAGAFWDGILVRAFCLQLFPVLGPLVETASDYRDSGEASRGLVDFMEAFLKDSECRGYLTICDSAISERLAKRHGMEKVESPVYLAVGA